MPVKIRYFLVGLDKLSEPTTAVAQSRSYWFVSVRHEFVPRFNREGEILLAVRKSETPIVALDFSGDDPPDIDKYLEDGYVSDIRFPRSSLDQTN